MVYEYKGIEYVARPLELEVDISRGVLYLHDTTTGITVLRICRIPSGLRQIPVSGTVTIDLKAVEEDLILIPGVGRLRKAPVFTEVSIAGGYFVITDEAGLILIEVLNVPHQLLDTLKNYEFTDITCGYTGKEE